MLNQTSAKNVSKGTSETINSTLPLANSTVYLQLEVKQTKALNKQGILDPKAISQLQFQF